MNLASLTSTSISAFGSRTSFDTRDPSPALQSLTRLLACESARQVFGLSSAVAAGAVSTLSAMTTLSLGPLDREGAS